MSSSVRFKSVSLGKAHNVQFSSGQDGIDALGKAHMRSTPFFRSFPNAAEDEEGEEPYMPAVLLARRDATHADS